MTFSRHGNGKMRLYDVLNADVNAQKTTIKSFCLLFDPNVTGGYASPTTTFQLKCARPTFFRWVQTVSQ